MDILVVFASIGLFALSLGYVAACEALKGKRS